MRQEPARPLGDGGGLRIGNRPGDAVDEPTAPRLLTLHNVWWTLHLVDEVRAAIQDGTLEGVRSRIAADQAR